MTQWQQSREPIINKEMPQTWEPITNKDIPWTEKTLMYQYKPYIMKFMIFKYGIQYELDNDFTNKELGDITPAVIFLLMCLEVYGNPDTNPKDNPTQGRS